MFELFVRKLPPQRHFLVMAGLEQALEWLETLSFGDAELAWLERQGGFSPRLLDYLRDFRFAGDVHAMPEGSVFFADEPVLRVTAPLPQAQFVESRLLNIVHFQTLIASKAARVVLAAPGRRLVDFGMRRAHGAEAALFAARAAYIAGFAGTATAEAGRRFGMPVFGTMAHSFVQAHASEARGLRGLRARPAQPADAAGRHLRHRGGRRQGDRRWRHGSRAEGIAIGGVRLDSGDLAAHARAVRRLLDDGGLDDDHRLRQRQPRRTPHRAVAGRRCADRRLRRRHRARHLARRAALDAVYKLQSLRRHGAPQTLGGQGHLAGRQAGVPDFRRQRRMLRDTCPARR